MAFFRMIFPLLTKDTSDGRASAAGHSGVAVVGCNQPRLFAVTGVPKIPVGVYMVAKGGVSP